MDQKMMRAKFYVESVTATGDKTGITQEHTVLKAVYGNGEANKNWSRFTPNGSLSITITNPECFGKFVPGKEYFIDFTPVEPAP